MQTASVPGRLLPVCPVCHGFSARQRFVNPHYEFRDAVQPGELAVNCPNDLISVFEFTMRYGPPLKLAPEPGGTFIFKLEDFRSTQEHFIPWRDEPTLDELNRRARRTDRRERAQMESRRASATG